MKIISFLTSLSLVFGLISCEGEQAAPEKGQEIPAAETIRLNLTPQWGGLEVDTKSAAELGKTDLYAWCWNFDDHSLVQGFPCRQSGINGSCYRYDLPKIKQYLLFTNINPSDTVDFKVSRNSTQLYHTLSGKGYSDTELICGGIPELDAAGQLVLSENAQLYRTMTKIEILLRIKDISGNAISNASGFIQRIWLTMKGSFFKQQRCYIGTPSSGQQVFSYYNNWDTRTDISKEENFAEVPVQTDENNGTLYEIFSGYVFTNGNSPALTVEFEFFDGRNPLKLSWNNLEYVEEGKSYQFILEVPESEFQ